MRNKKLHSALHKTVSYVTRDGSIIRELMHPNIHGNSNQSLALATVSPGNTTRMHHHQYSEEIYHIVSGTGRMTLGGEIFQVAAGDTVCIEPGTRHCIENTGNMPLEILCSCAPPYSHDDTHVHEEQP